MKFRIVFKTKHSPCYLPCSYQYELSSMLYNIINKSNLEFGNFLHKEGYSLGDKTFKFFNFSNLILPRYEIEDSCFKILGNTIKLDISFLSEKDGENMILAIFKSKGLKLGNKDASIHLSVVSIDRLHDPVFRDGKSKFKAYTPIVVSKPTINEHGQKRHQYIDPTEQDYSSYFIKNIVSKYQIALRHGLINECNIDQIKAKVLSTESQIKRKSILIKKGSKMQNLVIGHKYNFEIEAPEEILNLVSLCGVGQNNSQGFGYISQIRN